MALTDILDRIRADAAREAGEIVEAAERASQRKLTETTERAAAEKEASTARARAEAESEARTLLAGARLRARDRAVSERRRVVERALAEAVRELEALPDDRYAALIAHGVARSARGGERVLVGTKDAERLAGRLAEDVMAAGGPELEVSGEVAPFERGVLLQDPRMRVRVSAEAMVETRAEELTALAARRLFGEETGE